MKKFNLSLVSVLAMSALATAGGDVVPVEPVVEQPVQTKGLVVAGVAGIGFGNQNASSTDEELDDGMTYEGFAKLSIPLSENISTQFDIQSEHYSLGDDVDAPISSTAMGLHLSYRDPSLGLLGVFYTAADANPAADVGGHSYLAGIEGQYYINDMFTIYGHIGKGDIAVDYDSDEGFIDGKFWGVSVRAFITEDTLVEVGYSKADTDEYIDGDDKGEFTGWEVKAETKLMSSEPLYGYISYRSNEFDATTEGDIGKDKTWIVGLTYRFGVESLRHNDRYGATLDQPMLPIRGASFTENLD